MRSLGARGFVLFCLMASLALLYALDAALINSVSGDGAGPSKGGSRNRRAPLASRDGAVSWANGAPAHVKAPQEVTRRSDANQTVEQATRRSVIQQVCEENQKLKKSLLYTSENIKYNQQIHKESFLVEDRLTKTVQCYSHKAASTTWAKAFLALHPSVAVRNRLTKRNQIYRVHEYMGPRGPWQLLQRTRSDDYFNFLVVRHPLDRLLSTYRDRILNGCTWQAKHHVPRMFAANNSSFELKDILGNGGCVVLMPTFSEFLEYVLHSSLKETHWAPFYKNCAPCLVDYDAVIKLESAKADEAYVMEVSGLGEHVQLEYEHPTEGGKSQAKREDYFSEVPCSLLKKLADLYKMDFDLFEYELWPFLEICAA